MAEQFLYLITTGRTTGQPRQIEIWFTEHNGRYYIVSENRENSGWVKNIEKTPKVTFSVGTREAPYIGSHSRSAMARIVRPETEPELAKTVSELMEKKYEWSNGLIVEIAPL